MVQKSTKYQNISINVYTSIHFAYIHVCIQNTYTYTYIHAHTLYYKTFVG